MRGIIVAVGLSAVASACYLSAGTEFTGRADESIQDSSSEDPELPHDSSDTPAIDQDVTQEPLPPQFCAGDMNCPDGYYCELFSCGIPGGTFGVCLQVPLGCTAECINVVCGCDGNTYCNDCDRRLQGVSLAYVGACTATLECADFEPYICTEGTFCDTSRGPDSGCFTGTAGVCRPIPSWCPDDIPLPVCGCDRATYINDCYRRMASASRDYYGECEE